MAYQVLQLEREGHVATIRLDRPSIMNALDRQLTSEFHDALDEVGGEFPDIRVVIITGNGAAFCSGADLSQRTRSSSVGLPPLSQDGRKRRIQELAPHIREIPQATIAAVNGVAAGGGLSVALACDIRIAAEEARFTAIFVRRSIVPDTASSYTLSAVAGQAVASEMSLTGRIYDSEWAMSKGLVSRVVPSDKLMGEVNDIASEIASNPPLAVREAKGLMYVHSPDLRHVIAHEDEAAARIAGSEDRNEALRAFLEKRPPQYVGR
ncbi:MAG: enoyl-CoA hydratase/isomerase family protein [SAR202 cluster bacterium]|jgi:2-(1,2-epoxy-1,2-dihydrophenyl)acetyl-CoA isomerase|nr:enoyl-CoA hydratase/isomerase family protein [SAR202 cluster bacterium]MDP6514234.1 enoyl-CoA hydratase/isomerase family protein [SAR202 cluster bacterium]